MKPKFDKEMFKEVISSMMDGFDKETIASGLYNHLLESAEWFKEPETINCFILHPVNEATKKKESSDGKK